MATPDAKHWRSTSRARDLLSALLLACTMFAAGCSNNIDPSPLRLPDDATRQPTDIPNEDLLRDDASDEETPEDDVREDLPSCESVEDCPNPADLPNVTALTCQGGRCVLTCADLALDADGDPDNGCECPNSDEICDDVDNDCDGQIDEAAELITDGSCPYNLGVCEGLILACGRGGDGEPGEVCDVDAVSTAKGGDFQGVAVTETLCDDFDNNCDGESDENCCPDSAPSYRVINITEANNPRQFRPAIALNPNTALFDTTQIVLWQRAARDVTNIDRVGQIQSVRQVANNSPSTFNNNLESNIQLNIAQAIKPALSWHRPAQGETTDAFTAAWIGIDGGGQRLMRLAKLNENGAGINFLSLPAGANPDAPRIAALDDGRVVVAWIDDCAEPSQGVRCPAFMVGDTATSFNFPDTPIPFGNIEGLSEMRTTDIALAAQGQRVFLAWFDERVQEAQRRIHIRVYDAATGQHHLNYSVTPESARPALTAAPMGDDFALLARRDAPQGDPTGEKLLVYLTTPTERSPDRTAPTHEFDALDIGDGQRRLPDHLNMIALDDETVLIAWQVDENLQPLPQDVEGLGLAALRLSSATNAVTTLALTELPVTLDTLFNGQDLQHTLGGPSMALSGDGIVALVHPVRPSSQEQREVLHTTYLSAAMIKRMIDGDARLTLGDASLCLD